MREDRGKKVFVCPSHLDTWIYVCGENPLPHLHEMSEEKCALSNRIAPTLNRKARA